jgi:hypothetical protein
MMANDDEKEAIQSARTMLAPTNAPATEPFFQADAREAVDALMWQVDRGAAATRDLARCCGEDAAIAAREVDALVGVKKLLERILPPNRIHYLKCDPVPFGQVRDGIKRYEIRRFDRDFQLGDVIVLAEFDREARAYSGEKVRARIVSITGPGPDVYGLPEGIGVLGIDLE